MTARVGHGGRVRDSLGFPTPSFLSYDTVYLFILLMRLKFCIIRLLEEHVNNFPFMCVELEIV